MKLPITLFCIFLIFVAQAQSLLDETIRRISSRKKSVFLEKGVFHNGGPKLKTSLKAIRHRYNRKNGYERLVMDFVGSKIPRVYGYISSKEKKLYIDLFDTSLPKSFDSFGDSKFVESINFFPIHEGTLSIEVNFKKKVSLDIFYLKNPGRFVLDIKG